MEIIDINNQVKSSFKSAVALGNFDGIHIGHQYLLKYNIDEARKRNLKSSVLIFKNHTKTILNEDEESKIGILTSYKQKINILEKLGIEVIYIIDFDKSLMKLPPEKFIDDILLDKLNGKLITVGYDYKFGYKASGNSQYLKALSKVKEYYVNIIDPIYVDNVIVSSTDIRNLIRHGSISEANRLLGRDYSIIGNVVNGSGRGRKLGYPTANIKLSDNYVIPKTGVYKTKTIIDNKEYISLTNIGYNPTFNEDELKIETFIMNFNDNLYECLLEIRFIEFIRDDIKFNSSQDLIDQITRDVEYVKKHQ